MADTPRGRLTEAASYDSGLHYADCDRFEVYNYGTKQGTCDCTATEDLRELLAGAPETDNPIPGAVAAPEPTVYLCATCSEPEGQPHKPTCTAQRPCPNCKQAVQRDNEHAEWLGANDGYWTCAEEATQPTCPDERNGWCPHVQHPVPAEDSAEDSGRWEAAVDAVYAEHEKAVDEQHSDRPAGIGVLRALREVRRLAAAPVPGAVAAITEATPCPICAPVGHLWCSPDGYWQCSNCTWNSEENRPAPSAEEATKPDVWLCWCNYSNMGPICTHCGSARGAAPVPAEDSAAQVLGDTIPVEHYCPRCTGLFTATPEHFRQHQIQCDGPAEDSATKPGGAPIRRRGPSRTEAGWAEDSPSPAPTPEEGAEKGMRCPFCERPGEAVTATSSQALLHALHQGRVPERHHEGSWSLEEGVCECECSLCWVNQCCTCPDCTDLDHGHNRSAS